MRNGGCSCSGITPGTAHMEQGANPQCPGSAPSGVLFSGSCLTRNSISNQHPYRASLPVEHPLETQTHWCQELWEQHVLGLPQCQGHLLGKPKQCFIFTKVVEVFWAGFIQNAAQPGALLSEPGWLQSLGNHSKSGFTKTLWFFKGVTLAVRLPEDLCMGDCKVAPGAAALGRGESAPTHLCQLQSFSSRTNLASEAFHEVRKGSRVNSKEIPVGQCSHLAA